ncbi:hypothetical protein ACPJXG_20300 [Janthinobacterium sp. NFX145]|uniref:hypothetical protein n=1 Tax=Janthinobacterium sp. NFX145 TaxID=3415602 RepID=UPI003CC63386
MISLILLFLKDFLETGVTKKCVKDKEVALPKYLYRRDDGRSENYYVRLTAPTSVQPFLDKKEHSFRCSTGTADLRVAKVIGAEIVAKKRREWHTMCELLVEKRETAFAPLTTQLIQQIVGARLQSWLNTDNDERHGDIGVDDEHLAEIEDFCIRSDSVMRSVLAQGRASRYWKGVVEDVNDWCQTLGYEIALTDPQFPALIRSFAEAERTAQKFISARNQGDAPVDPIVVQVAGTRLSDMNDEFIEYKSKTVGPKPISMAISIWNNFIAFNGDVALDKVTSNDVFRFFEFQLFSAPKKWSQGYVDGHAKRALKEMFALARTKALMTSDNPVIKLEMMPQLSDAERKKRQNPRFAFSGEQINTLFSSDWYAPNTTQFRGKLGVDLAARYFGPLIGLLHGARVREFLQLMTSDIFFVDGVLCFKFQIEMPNENRQVEHDGLGKSVSGMDDTRLPKRSLKNPSVFRTIPVHPKLIELGFSKYVEGRRQSKGIEVPLFESSVPRPGGKSPMWGRAFEQSFLRFVRDKLAFGSGFGPHSFRHQFEDRIRDSQARRGVWPAGLSQLLSGRQLLRDRDRDFFREVGSEQAYGNGYQPAAALPFLEKLIFDDVNFPVDFYLWKKQ